MLKKTKFASMVLILVSLFLMSCSESGVEPGEVVSHQIDDTLHVFIQGSAAEVIPDVEEEPTEYWEDGKDLSWDNGNSEGVIKDFEYNEVQNSLLQDNGITELVIHDGIKEIGAFAFFNNDLEDLTLADSVTMIGSRAFRENELTSLTIPDSVTTIGSRAFRSNQLESITLGSGVTTIEDLAFNDNQLSSLSVPDNVTTLENGAFSNNELTEITLGSGIDTIQPATFWDSALTSITIGENVEIHDDEHTQSDSMMGTNRGFKEVYEEEGKEAGTYTWNGDSWEK